jgi:hypothetical protein
VREFDGLHKDLIRFGDKAAAENGRPRLSHAETVRLTNLEGTP